MLPHEESQQPSVQPATPADPPVAAPPTTDNEPLTTDIEPTFAPQPTSDLPAPTASEPEIRHNSTDFDTKLKNDPPTLSQKPALTPTQITAISLLTAGHTIAATASLLNLHRSTIHLWKRQPPFAEELDRRIDEIAQASEARIRLLFLQTTQKALDSLKDKDPDRMYKNCFRLLALLRPYHNRVLHSPHAFLTERVMQRPLPDPLEYSSE
jgi:hypothetical protein